MLGCGPSLADYAYPPASHSSARRPDPPYKMAAGAHVNPRFFGQGKENDAVGAKLQRQVGVLLH